MEKCEKLNEISELQKDVALLRQTDKEMQKILNNFYNDIKEIKDKLLSRPSWAVMIIMSALMTMCGSLIVYVITK